jgi:hypothetical protein
MGTHILRNVIQGSYYFIHANRFASAKLDSRKALRRAIRLAFGFFFIFAMADPSAAIAGFVIEKNFTGVGGNAVAIAGERIVIGAPGEANMTGAVYVYRYNSGTMQWEIEAKLVALDGAEGDQFGTSVAIAESRIVVGSPTDSDNGFQSGSAYVFRYYPETPGWLQEQKIIASDGTSSDFFGFSTAISDNRVVVGSPLEGGTASNRGAVYVYEFDSVGGWIQRQKLVASDGTEADSLGFSVAIEGDRIVAGAIQTSNNRFGSAYVFGFDSGTGNWAFKVKLSPSDGIGGELFGNSVSISGNWTLVGTGFGNYAYVFQLDNDTLLPVTEQELQPSDGASFSNFGFAVAVAGDQLVIGAPGGNKVHLFEFDSGVGAWVQNQILIASDGSTSGQFGRSVTIAGDLVAIGSEGAAHIYRYRLDSDGDGVTDDRDQCSNSEISPTVIIGSCDSGVVNALFPEPAGCTITDEIMNLAADAKSHGQFVSQVDKFLQDLQSAGILEPNEKNAIKDCAAQSNLP